MGSLKLPYPSGNSTILHSPAANPSADITMKLPSTTGSAGQALKVASANHSSTNAELEWGSAGGLSSDAQQNTIGGTNAGDSFSGTSATNNTLIGYNAGTAVNSGDNNTAYGHNALAEMTTASANTCIGVNAGTSIVDHANNTYVGADSGRYNV